MIRDKFRKNILATIDKHQRFDSSDFKIEPSKNQRGTVIVKVSYLIESKYSIEFSLPESVSSDKESYNSSFYLFHGEVCPGPVAYNESFQFKGENGVYDRITIWLNCIWEELSSNPIVKAVENQQQQIDEIFEKFESIKEEAFSAEEVEDIKTRLNNLETTLKEQISQNENDKKEYEDQISKLHTDIDTLKQTLNIFNKKSWLKSFTSKIFKWSSNSENRKMLKDGYTVIREFLPENLKNSLPE